MVEYAWRQPDGVIAPVLQTEGYTLMVQAKDGDYWLPVANGGVRTSDLIAAGWTPPGTEAECTHEHVSEGTHTNGYVIAHDAFRLASAAFGVHGSASREQIRDLARWFYDEMITLGQFKEPDQTASPFQVGAMLTGNDPEPPPGSVVVDRDAEIWYRDGIESQGEHRRWVSSNDARSWTKVAGNYGPVRVIALPQA